MLQKATPGLISAESWDFPIAVQFLKCYDRFARQAALQTIEYRGGHRMNIALPIITLVVGLIGGFFIGVYYLRRQMTTMQNDPEMLQKVAKQMGYNLNSKCSVPSK
jgi:uncharacterized protein YneF (UPF0154 family)